jgi:hypothetical protein
MRASGLHLVAACDAHNRQLVSRRRILKYSMYTMIQALTVRATAGHAAVRGIGQERPVFQISQNIAHPGRTENGTPGPMSVLPRQFNQRSYRRVVEYMRGTRSVHTQRPQARAVAQAAGGGRLENLCKRWRTEQTEQTFPKGSSALNFGYHVRALLLACTTTRSSQGAPSALRVPRASGFPRSHTRIGITTVLSAHTTVAFHPIHPSTYCTQNMTCRFRGPLEPRVSPKYQLLKFPS